MTTKYFSVLGERFDTAGSAESLAEASQIDAAALVVAAVPVRFLAEPLQESVGQVPDRAEPMLELIQPVQEPVGSVPM